MPAKTTPEARWPPCAGRRRGTAEGGRVEMGSFSSEVDVAVIGAGAAGIGAARRLAEAGG